MSPRTSWNHFALLLLCCLLPVAALGAALFLNVPAGFAALIALLLLIPLARRLL